MNFQQLAISLPLSCFDIQSMQSLVSVRSITLLKFFCGIMEISCHEWVNDKIESIYVWANRLMENVCKFIDFISDHLLVAKQWSETKGYCSLATFKSTLNYRVVSLCHVISYQGYTVGGQTQSVFVLKSWRSSDDPLVGGAPLASYLVETGGVYSHLASPARATLYVSSSCVNFPVNRVSPSVVY